MKQQHVSAFLSCIDLFFTFFKMGCVSFGGGYAMLPILERELIEKKAWTSRDELMDYFAIGQVTPGIIAVNVSTFIGFRRKGIAGGIIATFGFILPSLIIITIIAAFMSSFADEPLVQHACAGIRIAVGVLIVNAVMDLGKKTLKSRLSLIICIAAFGLSVFFKTSPIFLIIAAGLTGFLCTKGFSKKRG
ncbi:MAG: chromate transporter [Spirochaetaceae bacterium]|jgi:chromate transporter|nr:chromate transporter [Spirochaetaceae bacterium]